MGSVNIMGLTDSLKIKTGQDKIKWVCAWVSKNAG